MILKDVIKLDERFQTSVNIRFDIDKISKIDEFIPAKSTLNVLESYLENIFEKKNNKSTLLVGPYGKGKSHLLLVLLALLQNRNDKKWENSITRFYEKIKKQNNRLAACIEKNILCGREDKKRYLPVIISFGRSSLENSYRLALFQALEREKITNLMPDSIYDEVLKKTESWKKDYPETYERFTKNLENAGYEIEKFASDIKKNILPALEVFKKIYKELTAGGEFNPLLENNIPKIYENVAYELKKYGFDGMIIVFDEFSKFIEGEDNRETSKDMELVQSMCELCNASKEPDIRHIFVTHKSIKEYGRFLSTQILNSFKGVEGRLSEVVFRTNAQNYYELMMNVIHKDEKNMGTYYKEYGIDTVNITERTYNMTNMYTIFDKKDYENIIVKGCFPLAPLTVYTLVKISEKVGQNERTVFTFMSNDEPNTLARFVKNHTKNSDTLVSADMIFDYFGYIFEKDISNERCHREYIKAKYLIRKCEKEQADNGGEGFYGDKLYDYMKKIIKSVALLNMLNQTELVANDKCLISMVCLEENKNLYEAAKKALTDGGYLTYRRRSDNYVFRINTDANFEKEIEKRINKIKCSQSEVVECFRKTTERRFELPKEYNDEKKMTRYFEYCFEYGKKLENTKYLKKRIEELSKENFSDGKIILSMGEADREKIEQNLKELENERIVVICPAESVDFTDNIKKYYAINDIRNDEEYLKENETALEEAYFCLDDVVFEINRKINEHYMPGTNNAIYFYMQKNGEKKAELKKNGNIDTNRKLQKILSSICSDYYGKTPCINHELINKNDISSQIKKVRNEIMHRLLSNEDMSEWDDGKSAEATIYRAVLKNKGLIIYDDENADSPEKQDDDIAELLDKIRKFIKDSVGNKNCFSELYKSLKGKDFGVRNGVIPIYVAYCLSGKIGTPLVYYDRIENEISAQILSKADEEPEKCYLYIERNDGEKEEYLENIIKIFDIWQSTDEVLTQKTQMLSPMKKLRMITNGLQQWYRSLSGYCRYVSLDICSEDKVETDKNRIYSKCDLFRNDLAGNIESAREYLFESLPKLTDSAKDGNVDYKKCVSEIVKIKSEIEKMYDKLVDKLSTMIKQQLSDESNVAGISLRTVFERWTEKNEEKISQLKDSGVVFEYCVETLIRYVTKNSEEDEEKIINKISDGLIGLALRDYKDGTAEIFEKEFEKAVKELERTLKKENTTDNAVSFTMDTADGKQVKCSLSEYDESPATDIIENQLREVLGENEYDKSAQVSAILKILGEIVG